MMTTANNALRSWFHYCWERSTKPKTIGYGVYCALFKTLRKPPVGQGPRKITAVQTYLSDNITCVNAIYNECQGEATKTGIGLRTKIAKELLDLEDDATKAELESCIAELHAEAEIKFSEAKKGLLSSDPEDQLFTRTLVRYLDAFFEVLAEYVGLNYFTLIAGQPPEDEDGEFSVAVVNFGKTAEAYPRNLCQFNPKRFKTDVLGTFIDFLQATKEGWDTPGSSSARAHDTAVPYAQHRGVPRG
ncbi:hypothetical protein PsYK624_163100 [Phanerochaete sordida]|uniref:Uncharacterized protein n=1 Tax=Phanerochaete sordida TaxID=48140 RepID=A0A9P3LNA6_9APHY|nr:hypothetical protein PsYK624_163100 [Phanerochaete sordida]